MRVQRLFRLLLQLAVLSAIAATSLSRLPSGAQPARPNFIYILVDDLGYGDVNLNLPGTEAFRNPYLRTPNLARLARQSVVFTHHYAAAPVCSPSRAGLLTGRIPARANINLWIDDRKDNDRVFLDGDEVTIAEALKPAGYATAIIGKWHLNGADWEQRENWSGWTGSFPNQQGFDFALVSKENPHAARDLAMNTQRNPADFFSTHGAPMGTLPGWTSEILTDYAIQWLRNIQHQGKPFFLYLPYDAVHERVMNPDEYNRMYQTGNPDKDAYYANVTFLDAQIGRLLDALREMGMDENTVVFFSSDNGPEICRVYYGAYRSYGTSFPLYGQKRQLFEGGIRVPGMIRWNGRINPGVSAQPNSTLDALPTICELAGIEAPKDRALDGASLAGHLLANKPIRRTKPLYWQFDPLRTDWELVGKGYDRRFEGTKPKSDPKVPQVSIRAGDYVLRGLHAGKPFALPAEYELYDVAHDPLEKRELSKQQPALFGELLQQLKTLHREVHEDRLATIERIEKKRVMRNR